MLAAFGGAVLLHVDRLPPWIVAVAAGAGIARLLIALRGRPLPAAWLRAALAVALGVAVLASFRTLNGLAAGSALLVAMGSLKLLETRARRDDYVMIAVSLFLLLAACLDRQDLTRMPLYLAVTLIACAALGVIATPTALPGLRAPLRLAGRAIAYALPLGVLLFLLFPRLPGAFWALPDSGMAVTGLSDEMSPGQIDALTDSDAPAFRVEFDGAPPPPAMRYYRGPVLNSFDGATWRRERGRLHRDNGLDFIGTPYRQRITLEPHGHAWWFALDVVAESPDRKVLLTNDWQLIAADPVSRVVSYDALSYTQTRSRGSLTALARRYNLELPAERNPRALALARELRSGAPDDAAFARAALEFFRTGGFVYTLTPPKLSRDAVDDFVFGRREGFCGHYASAYATMMRAGGVPARVVTGYLGGEWNPIGRYFLVKQSDAHAWVEIWLTDRGWTRIDPTGVVEPGRLTRGLYDVLPSAAPFASRLVRNSAWLGDAVQAWDALNAAWRQNIVEFGRRSQLALLDRLGFESPEWRHLGYLLAGGFVAWLAWMSWQTRAWIHTVRRDPLARAWLALDRKLARVGLARRPSEPPLAYAARVGTARPDLAAAVGSLAGTYARLRFGPPPSPQAVRNFARAVAALGIARGPGAPAHTPATA
jgi:transglutaminase-like putative cysteine protease